MKNYLILIFFFILIISCKRDSGSTVINNKDVFKENTKSVDIEKTHKINTVFIEEIEDATNIIDDEEGLLISLPIKEKYDYSEMFYFLREDEPKWYKLPQIKKINYIDVKRENDTICCIDRNNKSYIPVRDIFELKGYRFRLPDTSIYQVYMACGKYMENKMVYKKEFMRPSCCGAKVNNMSFGYLILFNEQTQEANIIDIFNGWSNFDGGDNRTFSIDKNYRISVKESYLVYLNEFDENGFEKTEDRKVNLSVVRILKSGNIEINYPKRIDFTNEGEEIIINPRTIIYGSDGKVKSVTLQK